MKSLLVYIDPGFLSSGGHYLKFADRLYTHSNSHSYDLLHYVGPRVSDYHKQKLNLKENFKNISFLSDSLLEEERKERIAEFKKDLKRIFMQIKSRKRKYSEINVFMYTSHPHYISVFSELMLELNLNRWAFHLVLFYLNNSFIKGLNISDYKKQLKDLNKKISDQKNLILYMDSELSIEKYQYYFENKIKLIGFPLYSEEYVKSLHGNSENNRLFKQIGFFGNLTKKNGFDRFYNLVKNFKNRKDLHFVLKLNLKMHSEKTLLKKMEELRTYSNVVIYDRYLDEVNEYIPLIKSCDVVIIPYDPNEYPVQTSGVFIDAITHGSLVVVSDDTWMAKKVKELHFGLTFHKDEELIEIVKNIKSCGKEQLSINLRDFVSKYIVNNFINEFMDTQEQYDVERRNDFNIRFKKQVKKTRKEDKEKPDINKFVTYPIISSKKKLADVVNRLSFALALDKNIDILVYIDSGISDVNIEELETPVGQSRYMKSLSNFKFITDGIIEELDSRRLLIHDASALEEDLIYNKANRTLIIDPEYYSTTESVVLRSVYFSTLNDDKKEELYENSKKNYAKLLLRNKDKRKAYCFASGPSFDNYLDYDIDKGAFKIICNSIVRNTDFIDYIDGADLLVFADPVFHFGVSKYADQFRLDVVKYMEKTPSYIVVPEYTIPVLESNYPSLKGWLIGMPHKNIETFNFPTEDKFFVKGTSNILTLFMLPIASAIANNISIFGADGRKKNETYFWKHSKSAQYGNKMNDAFEVHPSFFRDRDYKDYYNLHCNRLELILRTGEKQGLKYTSLSRSYIPSLRRRYINRSEISKKIEDGYLIIRHYLGNIKRLLRK